MTRVQRADQRIDKIDLRIPLASNHNIASPLRYPGGKSVLSSFISNVIKSVKFEEVTYVEPYAGGAGVALRLLQEGCVSRIVLNDYDPNVYAFWKSILDTPNDFLELMQEANITIEEWRRQREILKHPKTTLEQGFAFFFLNRTNRSGVISGGVIGGKEQNGAYKIDARFNKSALREKIEFVQASTSKISVTNLNGKDLIERHICDSNCFIYADPPYVEKAKSLYMNAFELTDHKNLSDLLNQYPTGNWILTYDNSPLIKDLYRNRLCKTFLLDYSALRRCKATELLITSDALAKHVDTVLGVSSDERDAKQSA